MLKALQPIKNEYHNQKCGEIFCISPVVFNVTCCLCATKMHLEQFASHFQIQHLTLAEESINLEELEKKRKAKLAKDANLIDNIAIKEEDPADDPIKQEWNAFDDKSIQQLIRESENVAGLQQQNNNESFKNEAKDLSVEEKLKTEISNKPSTRNVKKLKTKEESSVQSQQQEKTELVTTDIEEKSFVITTEETQIATSDSDKYQNEYQDDDDDDNDMDKDWHLEEDTQKYSGSDSDINFNDELPYPCDICKRSYRFKNSLKRHIKQVHNSEEYLTIPKKPIKNTNENENASIELKQEQNEDLSDDTQKYSKNNSENDKNILDDELIFPCPICKRTYGSKASLKNHTSKVHNTNKSPSKSKKKSKEEHKCDECNETFNSARLLRGHRWKHTGIFCDICGKSFTQAGNMIRHKIRHTGIKPYKCEECGNEFYTEKELKAHLIRHTGLMPHICEICGKGCRDRGVLTAHMRRHTGERPAKCQVCGKCFFCYHDLNVHSVTHTTERPFKCDICGNTFQLKRALRVHKRIHSKDRKHVCKICGKGFIQSNGLNCHMRTHAAALVKSTMETDITPTETAETENTLLIITTATNSIPVMSMAQDSNNIQFMG